MKTWRQVLVFLLGALLMIPPVSAASDMPENYRFYDEITYLMGKGIVKGYSDGSIQPERVVTRAEAAVMIGRLKGLDGTQRQTPFNDVPKSHFASGFIAAAAEAGLLAGYPNGTFKPDDRITRGDMAIILKQVFNLGMRMDSEFKDVSSNMKAYGPIETILAASITIGYPNGAFQPYADVTRGQFSAFLARGMEPKFQNGAAIPNSYLRDKTKVYVMQSQDGTTTYVYEKHAINEGMAPEYMWVLYADSADAQAAVVERESFSGYMLGFPYSETYVNLAYPVAIGKSFVVAYEGDEPEIRTITRVGLTVKTPFKTFTNAVEVTAPNGMKFYYAEGHGMIKSLGPDGALVSELADVR